MSMNHGLIETFFSNAFLLKMTKVSKRVLIKGQIWGVKGSGDSLITIKSL